MTDRGPESPAPSQIIVSLFPGADLLGRGFEQAGYVVLRGPDLLLGHDVRGFHLVSHSWAGIIGGSPCQGFSLARRGRKVGDAAWRYGVEMLQEFCRLVTEADPDWFLLENVATVPSIAVSGYTIQRFNLNAKHCGVPQQRLRCFQFGYKSGAPVVIRRRSAMQDRSHCAPEGKHKEKRRSWGTFCELQGLPRDFALPCVKFSSRYELVGNGVPLPMARLIAEAIRDRGSLLVRLCACECGQPVNGKQRLASAACRKRIQRKRDNVGVTGPGPVTSRPSQFDRPKPPEPAVLDGVAPTINSDGEDGEDRTASYGVRIPERYVGTKGGNGVAERIISEMPVHDLYVEAFLGFGSVLRLKRPAPSTLAIDVDAAVIEAWRDCTYPGLTVRNGDARSILSADWGKETLVYADPPYLRSVRSHQGDYYRTELASEKEHAELLALLRSLCCLVMLSGYHSPLYDRILSDWRYLEIPTIKRNGQRSTEVVWCNFPSPTVLHDYRFVGGNYRERERLQKKVKRWTQRLAKLGSVERGLLLQALSR